MSSTPESSGPQIISSWSKVLLFVTDESKFCPNMREEVPSASKQRSMNELAEKYDRNQMSNLTLRTMIHLLIEPNGICESTY